MKEVLMITAALATLAMVSTAEASGRNQCQECPWDTWNGTDLNGIDTNGFGVGGSDSSDIIVQRPDSSDIIVQRPDSSDIIVQHGDR